MLFIDSVDLFLVYLEAAERSSQTVKTYRGKLTTFGRDTGVRCLQDVTPELVDRWVAGLRCRRRYENHPYRECETRTLSPVTIAGRVRDMKGFFNWCVRRGYVDRSPFAHLVVRRKRDDRIKAMSLGDWERLYNEARAGGKLRECAMLRFFLSTGCRLGELVGLRFDCLDMVKREAYVTGKTGPRWVDFDRATAYDLRRWLDVHPDKSGGFVFVSVRDGSHVLPGAVYQSFKRLAGQAGVERYNPHSIRHLVGQMWVDKTNLELTRQKLGHADITTTAVYANQDRERVKRLTEEIGNSF